MNNLEKFFKSKLDQRQFEFKEKYWEDLKNKLDSQSEKPKAVYWKFISGIVGVSAIIGVSVWFFYPKTEIKSSGNPLTIQKEIVQKNNADEPKVESKISKENIAESTIEKEKTKEEKPIIADSKIERKEKRAMNQNIPTVVANKKKEAEPIIIAEIKKETPEEKNKNVLIAKKTDLSEKEIAPLINQENIPLVQKIIPDTSTISQNKPEVIIAENIPVKTEKEIDTTTAIPFVVEIFQDSMKTISANTLSPTDTFNFNKLQKNKIKFFAGLYGGVFYTGKNLKTSDKELSEYISRRKNEESEKFNGNFGIDAGLKFKKWSISSGINYHQQGEIVDYKPEFYQWVKTITSTWDTVNNSYYSYTTRIIPIQIDSSYWTKKDTSITFWNSSTMKFDTAIISVPVFVVYNSSVRNIIVNDSDYIYDIDTIGQIKIDSLRKLVSGTSQKTTTRFSYFEIPLMLGYEIPFGKIKLMIRTGIGIGILSKYETTYLKSDISGTEQITASQLNQMMYNYLLRIGVLYRINSHLSLNIEPMFRSNINNVFRKNNFTQKYWNAGMNGGIIYLF